MVCYLISDIFKSFLLIRYKPDIQTIEVSSSIATPLNFSLISLNHVTASSIVKSPKRKPTVSITATQSINAKNRVADHYPAETTENMKSTKVLGMSKRLVITLSGMAVLLPRGDDLISSTYLYTAMQRSILFPVLK